jgi:hypothetical protein
MPRAKRVCTELLPPRRATSIQNAEAMLNQLVQRKVAEAVANQASIAFEPFFRDQAVANQIKRLQDVHWQNKFSYRFEDYGCMICNTKSAPHASLGLCSKCLHREHSRLIACVKRRADAHARLHDDRQVLDLESIAREAIMPAVAALKPRSRRQR